MQTLPPLPPHTCHHLATSPTLLHISSPPTSTSHLHLTPPSLSLSKKKIKPHSAMADRGGPQPHQLQVHPQQRYEGGFRAGQRGGGEGGGMSKGKIAAAATLLPVGGGLLGLSGLCLAASLVGLAVAAPIFLLCSPVLVPAALVAGLVLAALFVSGLFGLTGLTSLSWVLKYFRQAGVSVPQQLDEAKRRAQDVAVTVGQKTKEVGQAIQQKAQEAGK